MIRTLFMSLLMLFLCGCMFTGADRATKRAVNAYNALQRTDAPEKLDIPEAMTRCDSGKHNQLHRDLARLHCAEKLAKHYRNPLKVKQLRHALLEAEKARIAINTTLGFLPETRISYDTAGAFDVPEELANVVVFEKAALISDNGKSDTLALLRKIRLCHADAVAAYDAVLHAKDDISRCRSEYQRLVRCTRLADAAGSTLADLPEIDAAASRFDAYRNHQLTSR